MKWFSLIALTHGGLGCEWYENRWEPWGPCESDRVGYLTVCNGHCDNSELRGKLHKIWYIYIYINFSPTWIDIPPGKFGRKFGKAPTDAPTCSKPPVDADVYWGSRPLDKRFWSNGQMLKVTRLSTEKNGVHMSDGGFSAVILFGVFFFKLKFRGDKTKAQKSGSTH